MNKLIRTGVLFLTLVNYPIYAQTESSSTVPKGSFQIESCVLFGSSKLNEKL